jgi:CelD/BcsL family acetyltransferase involved in cellulose biosynthesis
MYPGIRQASIILHSIKCYARADNFRSHLLFNLTPDPSRSVTSIRNQVSSSVLPGCQLEVIRDRGEFDALEQEWDALFDRSCRAEHFFQRFNWLRLWADHYLDEQTKLSIIAGRINGRLVMVWPLAIRRISFLSVLTWMGEPVSQYGDVLLEKRADEIELMRIGWDCIKALNVDVIHLRKVRNDASVFPLLAEAKALSTMPDAAPYIDIANTKDFETYALRYSAKRRSNRRRHLRRLQEVGSIAFEQHNSGVYAQELVNRAITLKRLWLQHQGLISQTFKDRRFDDFLRAVALDPSLGIRVSALLCDRKPVGIEISFGSKGHLLGYIIAQAVRFQKQGVGVILAEYSVRSGYEQGWTRFDLLPPADPYKLELADSFVTVDDWAISCSAVGRVYAVIWLRLGRRFAKKIIRSTPSWLGRALATLHLGMTALRQKRSHAQA